MKSEKRKVASLQVLMKKKDETLEKEINALRQGYQEELDHQQNQIDALTLEMNELKTFLMEK